MYNLVLLCLAVYNNRQELTKYLFFIFSRIAPPGGKSVIQPLKICIGASATSSASSRDSSRKRHRQHSDSSNSSMDSMGAPSGGDPARKMSRVMGTSAEQESTFLSGRVNINYQKKKVITWCFPIEIFLWNEVIEIFLFNQDQATGRVTVPKSPVRWRCLHKISSKSDSLSVLSAIYFQSLGYFPEKRIENKTDMAEFVISLRNKNDLTMKKDRKSQN